jgi:hypothetical protein
LLRTGRDDMFDAQSRELLEEFNRRQPEGGAEGLGQRV